MRDQVVASLQNSTQLIAIDDSPRYQFWSERIPARILCDAPSAKVLTVLRNPIDRASHFNQLRLRKRRPELLINLLIFEEWIEMDFQNLKRTEVTLETIDQSKFAASVKEMNAWKDCTRSGMHGPLGRGLYALQLRQWF